MAIDIKRGLEQREFLLSNDKEFHRQIHSIKRTSNGGKYFRYDAERNEKGHADSFWAWALANSAVALTDNKNNNFYAQRRLKRVQLMNEQIAPEDRVDELVKIDPKQEFDAKMIDLQNKKAVKDFGESVVITKGKSLRQINQAFGYDKVDKERW